MTDKEAKVIRYQNKFEDAKKFLQEKYNKKFTDYFLSSLLGHYFDTDDVHVFLIFHNELDSLDLKEILDYEFCNLLGTIDFNSSDFDSLITDRIEKARIKGKGFIWTIHNNDKDPNPSKPHAHEYSLNVKLHLGTGDFYRNKKVIGKLNKKDFLRLQQKIENEGIRLPEIQ